MQLYQIIKEPLIQFIKEEFLITRETLSNERIIYFDINQLKKLIGYIQVFYSSNLELINVVNNPLMRQSSIGYGELALQYFQQKLEPFPGYTFMQSLEPCFDVYEIVDYGTELTVEVEDCCTYVVALPHGDEIYTTLFDLDYNIHFFYIFQMSFMNCFKELYAKHLDCGKHKLSTSNTNFLVLFRGKENTMEEMIEMIKSNSANHIYCSYTSHQTLKLFNPNKLFFPCKGKTCVHDQCYSIDSMIEQVIRHQMCFCGKKCSFEDIIIDTHFQEIMEYSKNGDYLVELKGNDIVRFYDEEDSQYVSPLEIIIDDDD